MRNGQRQPNPESGSVSGLAIDFDLAAVLRNDLLDHREAEPCPSPLLCGEHRLEDQIHEIVLDSLAAIRKLDQRVAILTAGAHPQFTAQRHRIETVVDQVDKDLLQ